MTTSGVLSGSTTGPCRWAGRAGSAGTWALGGAVFYFFHLPLPWMMGAMTFTTIAAVSGVRIAISHDLAVLDAE